MKILGPLDLIGLIDAAGISAEMVSRRAAQEYAAPQILLRNKWLQIAANAYKYGQKGQFGVTRG